MTEEEEIRRIFDGEDGKITRLISRGEVASLEDFIADPDLPPRVKQSVADQLQAFKPGERSEFHRGVSEGYALILGKGKGRDVTDIYRFILDNWQRIEGIRKRGRGVPALHAMLMEGGFSNRPFVEERKRLELLCARLDLKLAKRGRPRGKYLGRKIV